MTLAEEMTKVREHQATMKADLNWVKKEQTEQNKKLDHIDNRLGDFIKAADGKYASNKKLDALERKTDKIDTILQRWTAIVSFIVIVITILSHIFF